MESEADELEVENEVSETSFSDWASLLSKHYTQDRGPKSNTGSTPINEQESDLGYPEYGEGSVGSVIQISTGLVI